MSPSGMLVTPANGIVVARSQSTQAPPVYDITAALSGALGGVQTAGNKNQNRPAMPVADPEKIESVTALEQAVKAGQIQWVKVRDGNELPNWQNPKTDILIKFKLSESLGGKEKEFSVPSVFPTERLAKLAELCDQKGILKKEKPNPAIEELWDTAKKSVPILLTFVLGGAGLAGVNSYSKYKFRQEVKRNFKTDAKQIWSEQKISRGEIQRKLVGMPDELYTHDEKFWQYIDEHKNDPDSILLTDRALNFYALGHPGTGKTEYAKYRGYHLLKEFNSPESKVKAGVVDLGEIMKDSSTGNEVVDALLKVFGIGEREKAKIIAEEAEKKVNILSLELDDPDMTSAKSLDSGLRIHKHLYDMIADAHSAGTSVSQSKGFVLDLLGNIPFIGGFFKGLGGKPQKTKLRMVSVGITGNTKKRAETAVEAAREQRTGLPIEFFSITKDKRSLWIMNAIAEAYRLPENKVPINLVAFLAEHSHGNSDEELTFTPRSYRGDFMSTLRLFAKPIPGNDAQNIQSLEKLATILNTSDPDTLAINEKKIYSTITNQLKQVTSRAITPNNNSSGIDDLISMLTAMFI